MIDPKIKTLLTAVRGFLIECLNGAYLTRGPAAVAKSLNKNIKAAINAGVFDTTTPMADNGLQWPIGRWFRKDNILYECMGVNHQNIPLLRDTDNYICADGLHGAQQCDPPDNFREPKKSLTAKEEIRHE